VSFVFRSHLRSYEAKGEEKTIEADYVLVTVGRRPNTDELGLEELGASAATLAS
jgi:dihydrolipoamide dehydrogenase